MSTKTMPIPEPVSARGRTTERVGTFLVTYRRPALLQTSLRGVMAQTRSSDAVIVINNDPEDDVRARLVSEFPGVGVVDLPANEGSGGGFACALDLATRLGFTWSWLLDDDAVPEPGALEALLSVAAEVRGADRVLGIAASTQVSPHGTFGGARWRHRVVPVPAAIRSGGDPFPVDVAYWAGLLVHRMVVEQIGLPRADFFRCFADYEYCLRVRRAGMEIIAVPASRISHHADGMYRTVTRLGRRSVRLVYEPARHYYAVRNEAYTAWRILRNPLSVFYHLTRQVRLAAGDLLHEEQPVRRIRLRVTGTVDGLRGRLGRRQEIE